MMISIPCFLLRYKFGWAFGIRPRKSCAKIKVHFDDSTCIKTIFHMVTECEYGIYCEASRTIGRALPRVRCFEELIILTVHRSEICTLIYFPCLTSSILLLRPLSNDPRFIQCIYRYSHASKRFVEVFLIRCYFFNCV